MIEVVAAVVVSSHDGSVLLVRKRGTTSFMNPGGKPEAGESSVEALCRELHEELGLVVDPARLESLGRYETMAANEPGERLGAECFRLELDDPHHVVAAEIAESRWVDPRDPGPGLAPLAADLLLPREVRQQDYRR